MVYFVCTVLLLIGVFGLVVQMLLGGAHMGHSAGTGHTGHSEGGVNNGHAGHAVGLTHSGHAGHTIAGAHIGPGLGSSDGTSHMDGATHTGFNATGATHTPSHAVDTASGASQSSASAHGAGHDGAHFAQYGRGHDAGAASHARGTSVVLTLLSPLTFFSLCIGAGATGLLLKHAHFAPVVVALAAAVGALVFYGLLVRPILAFVFQFASKPSTALEGTIAHEAEALTSFDKAGTGLVRVDVDGQLVRILATLEADDRADAGAIMPGDWLTVTAVDGHTNSCRVARL